MVVAYFSKLALIFQSLFSILLGILGIGFLIGFHELGHFLFAKLFKVRVPSFSLGFGPRLLTKKIGETEFCISAVPFGGYVELAGAAEVGQGEQKDAFATDKGSFAVKPFYQKLCVMLGGILFNFIFAYFTMILLFMTGIPKTPHISQPIISAVHQKSAAENGGLHVGDRIISVNEQPIGHNIQKIQQIIQPLALQLATLVVERDGTQFTQTIVIGKNEVEMEPIGVLGVEFDYLPTPSHSFKDAFMLGVSTCNKWIKDTIMGFAQLRKGFGNVGGPVMIIGMTAKSSAQGWQLYLLLLALISINLAVLNLIPLPILDGGQILFYSIEALIGRPIPHKIREYIHIGTAILFLILFICLTINDISRLFSPYIDLILKLLHVR
jgi:regulator of sigma E protease